MRSPRALVAIAIALWTMGAASQPDGTQTPAQQVPSIGASASILPPGVPYASPTDPVRIAAIELPQGTIHGGQMASATVITTSNAAALTARVGDYLLAGLKTAPGTFVLAVRVPRLPFPSYRAHIVVTAIRADGASAQTTVSVKIKY